MQAHTKRGRFSAALTVAIAVALPVMAHAAPEWKPGVPRTAFATLFEWSWDSIAKECTNVLGPKGYAAVQVSPPQEHGPGGEWWRRYQPVSYQLVSRSGNRAQFQNMINTCRTAGVDVYVDVVVNHMADYNGGTGTAGSSWSARNFPGVPFSSADFHSPKCDIASADYDNNRNNVMNCDMPGLPDLNTGSSYVQGKIAAYMKDLLSLGVAGFRMDAAKHISPSDLGAIKSQVPGSYFFTQEVIRDGTVGSATSGDMLAYQNLGTVNEFNYIYAMKNSFMNLSGFNLSTLPNQFASWGFLPSDKATVFVNNHDTERKQCSSYALGGLCDSLSTLNGSKLYLADIFMLAYTYGYPSIASGYYFNNHDQGPSGQPYNGTENPPANCSSSYVVGKWDCVHRDRRVANMVGFRNFVSGTALANWVVGDTNQIAFSRGNKGFVAINNSSNTWQRTFTTGLPSGVYCNVISSDNPENHICPSAAQITVSAGQATLTLAPGSAVALHIGAMTMTEPQPPTAPTALVRTAWDGQHALTLGWGPSFDDVGVAGYRIYRDGVQIGSSSTTSFTDPAAPYGVTLNYTVKAFDGPGNLSAASNVLTQLLNDPLSCQLPTPPISIYSVGPYSVTLTLPTVQICDASGTSRPAVAWRIYRNGVLLGTATTNTYTDNGVVPGSQYRFVYRPVDAAGNIGAASPELIITTPLNSCVLPMPAGAPTVGAVTSSSVALSWPALYTCRGNLDVVFPVASYDVMRNGVKVGSTSSTSFTDSGLSANSSYVYTLIGRDSAGYSTALSSGKTATTLPSANTLTVYYKPGFATSCFHFAPAGGNWTAVPGLRMVAAEVAGYTKISVSLGSATSAQVAFNNCSGQWDSNGGANYVFNTGTWNYDAARASRISAGAPAPVTVNFSDSASTQSGQRLYLVGDLPLLGSWNTANAIPMNLSGSSWTATVTLPPGTAVQYKYIKKDASNTVTWEGGSNHVFTTPANGTLNRSDYWQ